VLEVEVKDGAALVSRFRIEGEVFGANPEVLNDLSGRMDEANRCYDDLRKALNTLGRADQDGGPNRGR
jgi:hypothetical protein